MSMSSTLPDFLSRQVARSQYYFGPLDASADESWTLACAGREECRPDYALKREQFRYYALEYVQQGQLRLEIGGEAWELGPGSLFAYGPQSCFRLQALEGEALVKYFVDLSGSEALAQLQRSGLSPGKPGFIPPTRWVPDLFEQLIHCGTLPQQQAQAYARDLCSLLFQRVALDQTPTTEMHPERYRSFQRCHLYIRDHFRSLHSLQEICQACHLDRAYLSRLFQEFAEDSPYRVLIRCKMEYAAGLLAYQQLSVQEAAAEVGFEDPYHFSRVFKRSFGISPRDYRKRLP